MLIDIGDNHQIEFTHWSPDRKLNPQYKDLPDIDKVGCLIHHLKPDGTKCLGTILFDSETAKIVFPKHPKWVIESWEPLTIFPSIKCSCGDHGFIRNGKWIKT